MPLSGTTASARVGGFPTIPRSPESSEEGGTHRSASPVAEEGPPNPLSRWERTSFGVVHATAALLLRLIGLNGLHAFARALGTVEWLINFKRRRRFVRALRNVLSAPPSSRQRRRWTREHFCQTRCEKLFYLIFDCIPRAQAQRLFSIRNQPLLDEAVGDGRGVYFAMSHSGSMHVIGLLMSACGYRRIAGVRERHEGGLRRYVQDRLDRRHPELRGRVLFSDAYPREIFRCLADGYLLGSMMDVARIHAPNQRTETVMMCGQERQFLSGPLRVAFRCKVAALQAFIVPEWGFRYRLDIVEMLIPPGRPDREEEVVAAAMHRYAANVEKFIRSAPSLMTRV